MEPADILVIEENHKLETEASSNRVMTVTKLVAMYGLRKNQLQKIERIFGAHATTKTEMKVIIRNQ